MTDDAHESLDAGFSSIPMEPPNNTYDDNTIFSADVDVVSLGVRAHLDLVTRGSLSCSLEEFARLSNGVTVTLRNDRGVGVSLDPRDATGKLTKRELLQNMDLALLPDEGNSYDAGERLPWHEFADLLSERGIKSTPHLLRTLPYERELSPALQQNLVIE